MGSQGCIMTTVIPRYLFWVLSCELGLIILMLYWDLGTHEEMWRSNNKMSSSVQINKEDEDQDQNITNYKLKIFNITDDCPHHLPDIFSGLLDPWCSLLHSCH